jgi:hypothetical protein
MPLSYLKRVENVKNIKEASALLSALVEGTLLFS